MQPTTKASRFRSLALAVTLASLFLGLCTYWIFQYTAKQPLAPSGGLFFPFEKRIEMPRFAQADPRWAADKLGPTDATLAKEGCALTCAAMVLARYGVDTDPQRLNRFVQRLQGYTPEGWIYWEAAAEFPPKVLRHSYEDKPSYALIDWNLVRGNPVIIRVRRAPKRTHFVTVIGKDGFDYLILDPAQTKYGNKPYPLKELGLQIEALRFFEPIGI